jgi:hypothetical protein
MSQRSPEYGIGCYGEIPDSHVFSSKLYKRRGVSVCFTSLYEYSVIFILINPKIPEKPETKLKIHRDPGRPFYTQKPFQRLDKQILLLRSLHEVIASLQVWIKTLMQA